MVERKEESKNRGVIKLEQEEGRYLRESENRRGKSLHQREYQPEDVNDLIIQYYKQEVPDKQSIRISDKDYADGKEMDTSKFRQSAIHQRQYKPEDVRTLFNSVFQRTSQTNSELGWKRTWRVG